MKSFSYASLLAFGYAVLGVAYILISSSFVAESADSVMEMAAAEVTKGLAYVLVTATLLLAFSFLLFRRIARAVDEVAQAREAFAAAERRATLGLFASAIGHDFNNVLMIFQLGLAELESGDPAESTLEGMAAAVNKAEGLVRRLSGFSRAAQDEVVVADARDEIGETVELLRRHEKSNGCEIEFDAPEAVTLAFYPILVHQIVMNLLMNAVAACPPGGTVLARVVRTEFGMRIEIEDSGPGLPAVTQEQLFAPFYTTKFNGTGLGLPSVKFCVEAHGGTITTGRSELGGARFVVDLPNIEGP